MRPLDCFVLSSSVSLAPPSDLVGDIPIGPPLDSLSLRKQTLDQSQLADAKRDPHTVTVVPVMPLRLIKPVSQSVPRLLPKNSWGVRAVRADRSDYDGTGVVVAVLDTGIDQAHKAFEHVDVVLENFTEDGIKDEDGHGTHCAGTLFGGDVGNCRIGIARGVKKALIGKVIGRNGGTVDSIVRAIQWAVSEKAHVISMSLGFDTPGYVESLVNDHGWKVQDATAAAMDGLLANAELFAALGRSIETSSTDGTVLVVAAGNESSRPDRAIVASPPAGRHNEFITVGAINKVRPYELANFSNRRVDVVAPGVDVISAWPGNNLMSLDGTSMATPHVAGVAALWAQKEMGKDGRIRSGLLRARLVGKADTSALAAGQIKEDVGTGLVIAP